MKRLVTLVTTDAVGWDAFVVRVAAVAVIGYVFRHAIVASFVGDFMKYSVH